MNLLLRSLLPCVLTIAVFAGFVRAQPAAPTPERVAELQALVEADRPMAADEGGGKLPTGDFGVIDTTMREVVRTFYRTVFNGSENVPMGWTGDYNTGDSGDTSQDYKDAVLRRINYIRGMAGLDNTVTFNATFSAKSQDAALMMSANDTLNHFPPNSWIFWTADGREAAENSNLAIGSSGPDSVIGYMQDHGGGNAAAGHRRWLLYPQTQVMGTGDVPGIENVSNRRPANSIWVFDGNFGGTRPPTREDFVAWPTKGHVPYQLVFPRWSLSVAGANFGSATVTMTRTIGAGSPENVATVKEALSSGVGEPTLVWVYDGLDANNPQTHVRPVEDVTYSVTVSNVSVGGQTREYSYDVIVFDSDVAGIDYEPPVTAGPANPSVGQGNTYTADVGALTDQFQWRSFQISGSTTVNENAENGESNITVDKSHDYSALVGGAGVGGSTTFRLNHSGGNQDETITLNGTFQAASNSQLNFASRFVAVTSSETTAAQLSFDDGNSWTTVWEQASDAQEFQFSTKTVSLSAYAGQTFRLRFLFAIDFGSWFPTGGWYFDNVELTNVMAVSNVAASGTLTGNSYLFNPSSPGSYGLQTRGVFYECYPLDWGPVTTVVAEVGNNDPLIGGTPIDGLTDWFLSDWFGAYNTTGAPWLFHADHGFIYRFPGSTNDGMFIYDDAMTTWWYSDQTNYPFLYAFDPPADNGGTDIGAEWIFYFEGSSGPRSFGVVTGASAGSFLFFNP